MNEHDKTDFFVNTLEELNNIRNNVITDFKRDMDERLADAYTLTFAIHKQVAGVEHDETREYLMSQVNVNYDEIDRIRNKVGY